MKPIKIAQTVSAALALQATAEASTKLEVKNAAAAAEKIGAIQPTGIISRTPDEISASATINLSYSDTDFTISYRAPVEWNNKSIRKYKALVTKEALTGLSKAEHSEMAHFEELRYRAENTLTAEQIIEQYRREKTGIEMLQLLKKYVGVTKQGTNSA